MRNLIKHVTGRALDWLVPERTALREAQTAQAVLKNENSFLHYQADESKKAAAAAEAKMRTWQSWYQRFARSTRERIDRFRTREAELREQVRLVRQRRDEYERECGRLAEERDNARAAQAEFEALACKRTAARDQALTLANIALKMLTKKQRNVFLKKAVAAGIGIRGEGGQPVAQAA